MRALRLPAMAVIATLAAAAVLPGRSAGQGEPPAWLYPPFARGAAAASQPRRLPDSPKTFTDAELRDLFAAPDWRPGEHPPMPSVVAEGRRPDVAACAYCHYPTGQGRPENAGLAGLPAAYILDQMEAFASGKRHSAASGATNGPGGSASGGRSLMNGYAQAATPAELREAAAYFSHLTYRPWIKVVEAEEVPAVAFEAGFPVALADKPKEPIAGRIVELADDQPRALLRDPDVGFTAYVPKGALARGAELARTGGPSGLPCAGCHGEGLRGAEIAPPIAGRSPTYLARSLYDFHAGARDAPSAQLMKPVAAKLGLADIVALAAYVGSLTP